MDKKKKKEAPAKITEGDERKKTETRKKMKKNKEVEAEASSKNTKSEAQQTIRQDEVAVITSDQSEENDRMKIGLAAKRTKKPPKSLENFICRPTARIPQRLSHGDCQSSCGGDGSSSEITMQSHEKSQKKDSNDCVTTKASTTAMPTSRKAPSKQTKKTDSKSLLTSDGPLYAVQPQTESKAPPSDRKSSSTPQKQTYSPPAAPSPLSSLQQNSGPHNGTQVFNVQIGTGGDLSTGTTITGSLPSQSLKDTRRKVHTTQKSSSGFQSDSEHSSCYSENSLSLKPTAKSKTLKSKVSDVDKCMNSANVKEDSKQGGDSTGSKNNFKANRRSKENDSAHPTNSSIKIPPSVLSTSKTSTDSSVDAIRTSETLESKRKHKKRIEGHDIDENRKRTLELTQTIPVAVQSKHSSSMVHIIDKKRARHSSNHEGNMQCYFQTSSSADCHYNTSIHSTVKSSGDEICSRHKQTDNLEKKQKVAKMMTVINQVDKIDRVENACKTIPQTANLSKISAFKSSKTFESSMCEIRPVVGHPIAKPFQSPSLISDLEPQLRKRGRPKMIRLEESSHGSKSHKSLNKPPILEHTNIPDSEVDLKCLQPVQRKRGRPRLSFSVQKQRSEPVASGSLQNSNLKTSSSKTKDAQICRKRNRLIMKTIVRNINKMKMKKRDEVLTQFLSGQKQSSKANSAHKSNEVEVESSVSDPTKSLSSLVTSFGGRLGPQINVSKRGTIYIGKRRGRKPKAQREISGEDSNQIQFQKSQKVDESTNQVNSWFTPGSHSISFDNQPNLSSSPQLFKYPNSFRKKLYTNNCDYDQHCAPKASSSQKKNAVAEVKSRPRSALRSTPLPTAMTQLGSVRMQECRAAHIARSVLMEQEKLKYKCHRKDHNYLNRDKIRRHKHKCKRKYLQLRTKRKDPEFLSEIEELVVRLSGIHIVHHVSQGDEAKSGRKSSNRKGHPHVLQCLPQNLHHPTMFQINFSGYYSPQSDFPHDSLHYVHMADFKRNNGCSSQPSEQIVTHCPVVHKLGFPLTGSGCYHSPCRLPLSATSFGFGLYRGYPPSATIYPSSPFLPSYVHPYSKHPILSPSKFHKRKHKSLRQDPLCGGKPQGTYPNVTSQSPNDWFSRSSWPWVDNRDKRLADERLRGGKDFKVGQSKDHASRSGPSSNFPFSSSVATKKTEKHKSSLPSYIGPAHLRPASKVRLAEHQRPWRWRGNNSNVDQAAASGYQEDETVTGPERDEDLQSTSQSERKIHHKNFLQDLNIPSSAKSQMTVQRSAANVQGATRKLVRSGSSWMKKKYSGKRASESFQTGGPVFRDNRHQLTVEQDRDGRDPRHNISRTLIQTNDMSPFSSSTATKTSLSHSSCTLLNKSKLKHIYKPFTNKSFQCQMGTRNVATRRGRGRPRKNPAAAFSPSLPTPPFHDGVAEKKRKGETETASEFASQCEESRMRKKRDFQKVRHEDDDEQGTFVSQEPSSSHSGSSSPSRDTSVSAHSQSGRSSLMPPDKKYEWAGLYSDVYKTKDTMSPSSLENAECLDYDPEEHQHGLLPAPIHVGKYLRLKRIHFQLPYDIYWLCAHNKLPNITDFPQKTATPNGPDGVMSLTQPEDRFYNYNVPHDCISDSPNRDDSLRGPAEEDGKEANQTDMNNEFTNQCEPLKQQKRGSDAENVPSALLIMPLSCEERSFILEHCIFLVRNYEKMRVRQAVLLREGGREQEKENKESRGSSQCQTGVFQDNISTKSDGRLTHSSLQSEGKKNRVQSRNLTQTLQGIYDVIVSSKGSSGQTLAAPLLNLCSRKRSGSAPVDLSMLQQQLLTGHYETLDAFHSDMLRVFYCAEKYYGCESSVGRNVKQLREVYNNAYKEAQTHITNFP